MAKKLCLIVNKSDDCIEIFPDSRKMRLDEAAKAKTQKMSCRNIPYDDYSMIVSTSTFSNRFQTMERQ